MPTYGANRPEQMANPSYWSDGTDELELIWGADSTVATLRMIFAGESRRMRLTVAQLDTLRAFLNANIE